MSPRTAVLVAIGLAAVTGGCTLAPRYHAPAVAVPAGFGAPGPWQTARPGDALPRGPWWERYGDAILDGLEQRLESDSPDLAAAAARYAQARALAAQAGAGLFPFVGASALVTHDRQSDNRPLRSASQPAEYRDYSVGGAASYEFDLWGRVRNLATAGRASAQASAADLASVRLSLEAELAADYMALRGADAELKLLSDTAAAYRRALALTSTRHEGGMASGLDVARAQTQLAGAEAQVTDLGARRALYEHAVARLVGATPEGFTIAARPTLPAVPEIPLGLPSTLLERRPDVAAAERRTAAANAAIGIARSAYFPRIVLSAVGGYETTGAAGWIAAPNRFWAVGPQAALTLIDAGARGAEVARSKGALEEAAARYRATVLSAFQEVADNLALLELLQQEDAQQSQAARAAERALELATNRYTEGAVSYLDVVVAQTVALQAERAALGVQTRELTASVGLVRGLGGGWTSGELPSAAAAGTVLRSPARP
jgi:NodT family efflux transporter outer membrane factor (OMF) lipoprotein